MRARWLLLLLLAAPAGAEEGEGAPGKGEDPHAALVKRLSSGDAAEREKAVRALGRGPDGRAVPFVRAALDDPDARVRAAAAVALVRLDAPDDRVLDALVAALRHPDWYTRWDACVALGSLGPPARSAAPALLAAAGDKDLDLARDAVNAVLRVAPGDPQICAGLVRMLESEAAIDRRSLLGALEEAEQIALARDWLAKEMVSNRHGLRGRAATLLGKCGVEGLDTLVQELRNESSPARSGAMYMLADEERIGPAVFVDVLADPQPEMRRAAIKALLRRKAADAAPAIAKLLADEEFEVRLAAAQALAGLKTPVPEAGPPLVRLVTEGDFELATAALDAMRATGLAALAAFLEFRVERAREGTGAVLVVRLHPEGVVEDRVARLDELLAALEDNRHGAPLAAALRDTLAKDEDVLLALALGSEDAAVRKAGAILLGHLARDRAAAIRALRNAARTHDADVRAAAEEAIGRLQSGPR